MNSEQFVNVMPDGVCVRAHSSRAFEVSSGVQPLTVFEAKGPRVSTSGNVSVSASAWAMGCMEPIEVFRKRGACIEINAGTGVNIAAWLLALPAHDSDEAAISAGHTIYRASRYGELDEHGNPMGAHVGAYPGSLIILN